MEPWIIQLFGLIVQTLILLGGTLIAIGGARTQLNNLDKRIDKLEIAFTQVVRQDERLNSIDQRMLAEGRRIDRLEYGRRPPQEKYKESN